MTIKITELANLSAVYGNTLVPVVANVAGTLTTVKGNLDQIGAYIKGPTEANIVLANTVMKSYIDGQINAVNTSVTLANTIQSQQIASANIGIIGYIDQANTIQNAYVNGQISAANAGVTAANVGMIGYVNQSNVAMKGYVDQTVLGNVYSNVNVQTYLTNSWSGTIAGNTLMTGAFGVSNVFVPTAANSTGIAGTIVWDSNYLYVCVGTNTWKRANIATW